MSDKLPDLKAKRDKHIQCNIVELADQWDTSCNKRTREVTRLPRCSLGQWLEHPTSVTEVTGLNPCWNLNEFFSCPFDHQSINQSILYLIKQIKITKTIKVTVIVASAAIS